VERWRRIALEAAKQSRGSGVPTIAAPIPLPAALKQSAGHGGRRILLWEQERQRTIAQCMKALSEPMADAGITLAMGPEGGWTEEEAALFLSSGWMTATLGTRILRAETAVIASLSIVSAQLAEILP
jgi:16S rRNA (uracil1498-N3)-methyltransferase